MIRINFNEEYPWEKGFSFTFHEKILPNLLYVEMIRRVFILFVFLNIVSVLLIVDVRTELYIKLDVLICFMLAGAMVSFFSYNFYIKDIKRKIIPHILDFMSKDIAYFRRQNYIRTADLKMFFDNFDYVDVDDVFYRNTHENFFLSEFGLTKRIRLGKTTLYQKIFQGVFFNIFAENMPFILVKERPLFLSDSKYKGHPRIILEDPIFENIYDSYCDDQVAARKILEPRIIEKILELGITSQFINKNITNLNKIIKNDYKILKKEYAPKLLFNKNGVSIIIPSKKDLFEPIRLFRNALTDKNVKLVMYQLHLVLEIIKLIKTKIIQK